MWTRLKKWHLHSRCKICIYVKFTPIGKWAHVNGTLEYLNTCKQVNNHASLYNAGVIYHCTVEYNTFDKTVMTMNVIRKYLLLLVFVSVCQVTLWSKFTSRVAESIGIEMLFWCNAFFLIKLLIYRGKTDLALVNS